MYSANAVGDVGRIDQKLSSAPLIRKNVRPLYLSDLVRIG